MAQSTKDIEQFDFDSLSDGQLRGLQSRIREIINRRVQSRLDEFRALAREAGFEMSLSKIGEDPVRRCGRPPGENRGRSDQRRGPLPPLYRNPDDPAETWSGRGHRPRWLLSQLEAGKSLSDLRIDHQPALQHADEPVRKAEFLVVASVTPVSRRMSCLIGDPAGMMLGNRPWLSLKDKKRRSVPSRHN